MQFYIPAYLCHQITANPQTLEAIFPLPLPRLLTQIGPENHPTSYSQQVATALGLATSPKERDSKGKYLDKDPIDEHMEQQPHTGQSSDNKSSDTPSDQHAKPLSKAEARCNRKRLQKAVVHNPDSGKETPGELTYEHFPELPSTSKPDDPVPEFSNADLLSSHPFSGPYTPSNAYIEDAPGSIARLGRPKPAFAPWVEPDDDWEIVEGKEGDKEVMKEVIDKYIEKNARPMDRFSDDEEEGLEDWV